jgi:hypothetical protein
MSSAEQMKEDLGSSLMCLAKWKQVSLHLPTGLNNSCYHPPLHPIPAELLADQSHPHCITHLTKKSSVKLCSNRSVQVQNAVTAGHMEDHGQPK